MLNFNLDSHFAESAYPKRNVHRAFAYDERVGRWENVLDWEDIYSNRYFFEFLVQDAIREMNAVLSEEQPCKVMLANLSLLFWAFKGPCYNYGGFEKISQNSVDMLKLNRNYITDYVYALADKVRGVLEEYSGNILPELQKVPDAGLFTEVENIYDKLLLLLYDLITESVIFFIAGDVVSSNEGLSAFTDLLGTTTFSKKLSIFDNRSVKCKSGEELLGPEKYKAYCAFRPEIAGEVKRNCPGYPVEQNTWLFYRIDVDELNPVINEIYGVTIPDLTNEEKRGKVNFQNKIVSGVGEFYKDAYGMMPVVGGFIKKGMEKKGIGEKYRIGKLSREEQELRRTISLYN